MTLGRLLALLDTFDRNAEVDFVSQVWGHDPEEPDVYTATAVGSTDKKVNIYLDFK